MGVRYIFTGEIFEEEGTVRAVFKKSAFWSMFHELLEAFGLIHPMKVLESEKQIVSTVEAINRGHAIHGDIRDIEGYRTAWHLVRERKTALGLSLDTDSIG